MSRRQRQVQESQSSYKTIRVKTEVAELLAHIRARLIHVRDLLGNTSVAKQLIDTRTSEILKRALDYYAAIELGYIRDVDPEIADEIIRKVRVAAQIAEVDLLTEEGIRKALER